jgi:hypothetical protein
VNPDNKKRDNFFVFYGLLRDKQATVTHLTAAYTAKHWGMYE